VAAAVMPTFIGRSAAAGIILTGKRLRAVFLHARDDSDAGRLTEKRQH
jgi:hypothetical protein